MPRCDARVGARAVHVALCKDHFPMISDEGRNHAFEEALRVAIADHIHQHGRAPVVLDIGGGTGLLAMLAVRHGAARVVTVEVCRPRPRANPRATLPSIDVAAVPPIPGVPPCA